MITQKRLKEMLAYDPATGAFTWRVSRGGYVRSGFTAGYPRPDGYICIGVDKSSYLAHRLAWFFVTRKWPRREIDHINCIRDDNRITNLREATFGENQQNVSTQTNNTSGYKGVTWDAARGKWMAQITVDSVHVYLGRFDILEDAAAAYAEASERHHKEFGRLA